MSGLVSLSELVASLRPDSAEAQAIEPANQNMTRSPVTTKSCTNINTHENQRSSVASPVSLKKIYGVAALPW